MAMEGQKGAAGSSGGGHRTQTQREATVRANALCTAHPGRPPASVLMERRWKHPNAISL